MPPQLGMRRTSAKEMPPQLGMRRTSAKEMPPQLEMRKTSVKEMIKPPQRRSPQLEMEKKLRQGDLYNWCSNLRKGDTFRVKEDAKVPTDRFQVLFFQAWLELIYIFHLHIKFYKFGWYWVHEKTNIRFANHLHRFSHLVTAQINGFHLEIRKKYRIFHVKHPPWRFWGR